MEEDIREKEKETLMAIAIPAGRQGRVPNIVQIEAWAKEQKETKHKAKGKGFRATDAVADNMATQRNIAIKDIARDGKEHTCQSMRTMEEGWIWEEERRVKEEMEEKTAL